MTIRPIRFLLFCFSLILIISSCKKINEATDLGDDVIPGVDGVHTFDTTISVETYNSIFDPLKDSAIVLRINDHILGNISADPFFGKTNAKIFLELKPELYPWNFSGVYTDSLYIDSVVLVLGWTGTYGDTTVQQTVTVREMDPNVVFKSDSFYTLRNEYFTSISPDLGVKSFFPSQLNDSVYSYRDTTAGQLRIRLNDLFGQRLLDYDTVNAYRSDSAFKTYFRGFEIAVGPTGNALMSFGLVNNPNTKLAIYYHYTKGGLKDTTVSYFGFTGASARHNFIDRDFLGTPLASASATSLPDDLIYLINTPGSYATVKIPGLRNLSNSVINRAELIVEQVYDPSDLKFTVPQSLLLDVYDSSLSDYKYTPYSFVIDPQSGAPDPGYGLYGTNAADASGNPIRQWKFNITRYVQNILTKQEPLHDFRLFTAQNVIERIRPGTTTNTGNYVYNQTFLNTQYAFGRVRVGGGGHATQRMRLRIIYTKI